MSKKFRIIMIFALTASLSNLALAEGTQSMPGMPLIKPKKSYSVKTTDQGEELVEQRGFGDKEPEVRMMNLMMVEGSGYEGMDMSDPAAMKAMGESSASAYGGHSGHGTMASAEKTSPTKETGKTDQYTFEPKINPDPPKVGANLLSIRLTHIKSGKAANGIKLKAQVYMTNMDMGTEEPKVKEVKPGEYQVKAIFSMQGPWAVKLIAPDGEKVFNFQATK